MFVLGELEIFLDFVWFYSPSFLRSQQGVDISHLSLLAPT
jgi:hypothetical protein